MCEVVRRSTDERGKILPRFLSGLSVSICNDIPPPRIERNFSSISIPVSIYS